MNNEEGKSVLYEVVKHYGLEPLVGSKIICPFHNDEFPSLLLNFEENNFYCFGCGKHGNAVDFVKYVTGLNDLQAYREVKHILSSSEKEEVDVYKKTVLRRKKTNKQDYNESYDYYYGLKKIRWELEPPEGFEKEFTESKRYMLKRGFTSKSLNHAGAKLTFNNAYPLIFPMLDNGKFKGWVCRTTNKDIEKKRKYLYNKGFSRVNCLVGEYGSEEYVFVVEGYMDKLKFNQFGIKNVVAVLGWKMSKEQEKKLKESGVKYVISALDNDVSGKRGTEYLKSIFPVVRFCYLKGVKDAGEMDKEQFNKMYKKTMWKFRKGLKNGFT